MKKKDSKIASSLALEQIKKNNKGINREVLKVLINYKIKDYLIGDSLLRLRHFKLIRDFFLKAKISVNLHHRIDVAMLQYNPYVDQLISKDLGSQNIFEYDVIIIIGDDEALYKEIVNRWVRELDMGTFETSIFSLTRYLKVEENNHNILPPYQELYEFIVQKKNKFKLKKEIFIQNSEIEWANQWLQLNGVKSNEKVIIIIDSSSLREKLLPLEVHFKIILFFLENDKHKILVLDKFGNGKSLFYNEWFDNKFEHRFIFAQKLKFRHELMLLSSDYIRFIFGPCTGIMHCASAIHNHFVSKYGNARGQPDIMVYAGTDSYENDHKSIWWGDDEEAKCCVVKYVNDFQKEIVWINPNVHDYLPCSEYTSLLLQNFIKTKFWSYTL
ncbi:glycosyltransferase family 9 protein [Maribacter sp. 2307UL18-2]|uniref:glycosyltransferase family 9 protein n=1 Tax=Maribacter sp. 2307UL18-2 TaxID=3386274 RepID=UPI0039BC6E70